MQEHSIFISYRKDDGEELATWIFKTLFGHSQSVGSNTIVLTTQMDLATPSGSEWKDYLNKELSKAHSLIVVCSPATMYEKRGEPDWFNYEINWWIQNRKHISPILVAQKKHANKYVPYKIQDNWKDIQVAEIELSLIENYDSKLIDRRVEIFTESISRGIFESGKYSDNNDKTTTTDTIITNIPGIFTWEKDRFGKYINVNENYARAAGFDSPKSIVGKDDFMMPWRSLAELFREGDSKVMKGGESGRLGSFETEIMFDRVADIVVNEVPMKDHSNRIIGVRGCFLDITGQMQQLTHNVKQFKATETGVFLGEEFDNQYLDLLEIHIFRCLIKGVPKEKMAVQAGLTTSQVKGIIHSLKIKLQCSNEEDILASAVRSGLPLELFIAGM
ncbi:MAG: TIR domain-containing protein [Saprospiraceae bacterium]|nr:TIR domain-containing protein [Saprospiraceae bacterium]